MWSIVIYELVVLYNGIRVSFVVYFTKRGNKYEELEIELISNTVKIRKKMFKESYYLFWHS